MGTFFLAALAYRPTRAQVWGPVSGVGLEAWGWALAAFAAACSRCCSRRSSRTPRGLWDGIYTGLKYWLGQQHVAPRRRAEGVLRRDPLSPRSGRRCCSARSARWRCSSRRSLIGYFLLWDFLLSLAVYSWASEKFAWLVMHPLLPLLLLSGAGLQAIWQARGAMALRRHRGRARSAIVYYAGSS